METKILVVGGANGCLREIFGKVAQLQSKNAFAFGIGVGNVFGPPLDDDDANEDIRALLNGEIEIPIPFYFTVGDRPLPNRIIQKLQASDNMEVCSNLLFLGKRATITTSEGIKLVALGGTAQPRTSDKNEQGTESGLYSHFYSEEDVRALIRQAGTADILITNDWPTGIRDGSKVSFPTANAEETLVREPSSHQWIAELSSNLKPRYHFTTSDTVSWEREPFFQKSKEEPITYSITRFLSLANFGAQKGQKWIYAFKIDPTSAPPISVPAGTTASPLISVSRKRSALEPQETSYRYSATYNDTGRSGKRSRNAPRRAHHPTQQECFFCLSGKADQHLIKSIGDRAYLATAKGPLTTNTTYPELGFPAHVLIIPIQHGPTIAALQDPQDTYKEMQNYREALNEMLKKRAGSELGSVVWEISRSSGVHPHWQYLPVPTKLLTGGVLEAAFRVEAQNEKYPPFEQRDVGDGSEETTDFFRVIIWDPVEKSTTNLFLPLDATFRFDLQFGRRVLAKLLGLEKRLQWKDVTQTHEEEQRDVDALGAAFEEFDFTLR